MSNAVLFIKTSSLGDVVHHLPAVTDARAHFPNLKIDWVVEEAFAEIPALHPGVRRVIPVAMRRWRKSWWRSATREEISAFRTTLRDVEYRAVIDTQGLLKSALLARWSAGARHGYDRHSVREPLASFFYNHTHSVDRRQHAVTRNRELTARSIGYSIDNLPLHYGIAAPDLVFPQELPERFSVFLHGTSRDAKLWPEPQWIELGRALSKQGIRVVMTGGSVGEQERAARLARRIDGALVLPRLRLRELAVLLQRARAVIGVDSGLTHLATALNVPTVAIYTDTTPTLTGVFPADPERALNLGERGVVPTTAEVAAALSKLKVL